MKRISAMYEHSGGTDYRHTCYECRMCVRKEGKRARYQCLNYGEEDWNEASIACKLFNKPIPVPYTKLFKVKEPERQRAVQMELRDFIDISSG